MENKNISFIGKLLNGYIKSIGKIDDKQGNLIEKPEKSYGITDEDIFNIWLNDYEVVYTKRKLIFFIYPSPKGSEENQFAPILGWGKQIDFQNELFVLV